MIIHRLAKAAHIALDGEGARLFGGRWNSPGRPMIYASASPSLALLEVLVHLDLPLDLLPDDYRLLSIEMSDDATREVLERTPDADACLRLGDDFLSRGAALALVVPSVVVPQERNVLINPRHPGATAIRMLADQPFAIDRRLVQPP